MKPVAEAIHYAHERRPASRPETSNMSLLDDKPRVRFWRGPEAGGRLSLTLSGQVVDRSYMPPEQAAHTRQVGRRSDVYSLEVVLYHMLTGRPFVGEDLSIIDQVLNGTRPASGVEPGVPLDLETICMKCFQKEPAGRYRTALELADLGHA
jgi:serine/threonine protein kinase